MWIDICRGISLYGALEKCNFIVDSFLPRVYAYVAMARKTQASPDGLLQRIRLTERGWTKEELGRRAGVSSQTVRKAERGESISEVSRARIAKALGVAVEKLFPVK